MTALTRTADTAATAVRRRTRRALAALVAVTGLVVLTGCMKIQMDMVLTEDDAVSGSIVMAISDSAAEAMGMDPAELADQMTGELGTDLPEGATQEPYSDGEYTGSSFSFTDTPISEFAGSGTDELSITREGDEYVVAGTMDLSDSAEESGEVPQEILDTFVVSISVTFPGEITETNGTVDGTTVTWNPAFGETTEMTARGSAVAGSGGATTGEDGAGTGTDGTDAEEAAATTSSGFPWWIVGLVVGLAVVGLVVTLVVRNNRRPGPPAPQQGDAFGSLPGQQAPPAPGTTPPGPPSQQPGQPPVDPYDPNPR